MIESDRVEALKLRYESLKGSSERTNCEAHWQEIAEYILPTKTTFTGMRTAGDKRMTRVLDTVGIVANEMLAAGLHGMATNPSSQWFSLRMIMRRLITPDGQRIDINELPSVQKYLADVEEIIWTRLYQPGTNFTTALHEMYLDMGAFGTAILFVSQRDDGGLIFECRPLAECVIAENSDGRVDTVFRRTKFTVRQMMQMADRSGWKVSDAVRQMWANDRENQKDNTVEVIHAVYPRKEREYGRKDRRNKPWASCYFEYETGQLLEEGGFDEFPYLVGRWSKYSGEVYARSPGMTALPDIKMLQAMQLAKIKLVQKAADPPMWVRDEGVVGPQNTVPGGVTYWRGNPNEGVMLHPTNLQGYQALTAEIQAIRESILRIFFADLMRMTDRANMTATEVMQRTAEQMRLLGPLIGRLESEVLGPLIERVFGILSRLGLLPAPPPEIQGEEFTVEYVSPIATAQKQVTAQSILQVMRVIAGTYGPEIGVQVAMKATDPVKLFRWAWDLFNADPDLLKDEEAVAAMEQLEQMQRQMTLAQPAADIVQKGAKAVKDVSAAQGQPNGVDVQGLVAQIARNVQENPRAREEVRALMNGEMPSTPAL